MIKKTFVFLALFPVVCSTILAQTTNLPANYYNSAAGLNCGTLKTALFNIISANNNTLLYDDVLTAHPRTDKKRNDANSANVVWDMFSDNPNGPDPYTFNFETDRCGQVNGQEGNCFNREHLFPQSWFNNELPMRSDLFHVFPTDSEVNAMKSNFPVGEVSNVSKTSLNGSKVGTGNNFSYTSTIFEPINEYKGDVARAILYMAVRYESQIAGWRTNSTADNVLNGTSYPAFDDWHIKLLYKWHVQDPVSDKEKKRNDSVFVIQGNRNPFIDRPEWVYQIWSCTGLILNTSVTNIYNKTSSELTIYPNPVTGDLMQLKWELPNDHRLNYEILDLFGRKHRNGILINNQGGNQINLTDLPNGNYIIRIKGEQIVQTGKFLINRP
jgi:endonuclease I